MFKMFNNFYKVLVAQFSFFLYNSNLGNIQFVSGLSYVSDTCLEERQRGETVLRTTWILTGQQESLVQRLGRPEKG